MAIKRRTVVLGDVRAGINQVDPPAEVPDRQVVDARNVEAASAGICRKRQGCAEPGLAYSNLADGKLVALFRHTPTTETTPELWAISDYSATGIVGRMVANATSFAAVSTVATLDLTHAELCQSQAVSFNGKLFIAMPASKAIVWDGTSLRYAGLAAPLTALSSSTTASGAVTDSRKYRCTYIKKSGSTIELRSDPSPEQTSATALSAQKVTWTVVGATETHMTHWELWAASDDTSYTVYYRIGEATLANTIEDNQATLGGEVLPEDGWNAQPHPPKHIVADDNRLVMASSWNTAAYASRVWFTPAMGASNIGDDERVPSTTDLQYYIDINPGSGGGITALGGPMADAVYVFKQSQLSKLVKTGVAASPYRQVVISRTVGAISAKSVVMCEDESGAPALYFLSRRGPYRIGPQGLEYLGLDIEPTWVDVNIDATKQVAHGVYHHRTRQIWWWVATGSSNSPNLLLVFDTRFGVATPNGTRGGWTSHEGTVANALASVMYSKTLGAAALSHELKPYITSSTTNRRILACDKDGVYADDGTAYESWFTTKALPLGGYERFVRAEGVSGIFKPENTPAALTVKAERDFGADHAEYAFTVPVAGDATRVIVDAPDAAVGNLGSAHASTLQLTVTDNASATPWQLDTLMFTYATEEGR